LTGAGLSSDEVDIAIADDTILDPIPELRSLTAQGIRTKLKTAGKTPKDIRNLLERIKAAAKSEQVAQSEIEDAEEEHRIDIAEEKEGKAHTRLINAYIAKRLNSPTETRTRIQIRKDLIKNLGDSYNIVNPKLIEHTAETKASRVLTGTDFDEIVRLADETGLRMRDYASPEEMRREATLGELTSMLRQGKKTAEDL